MTDQLTLTTDTTPSTTATTWDLDVFVPGEPVTKGSAKAFMPKGGRFPVVKQDNSERQRAWSSSVCDTVLQTWDRGPHDAPFAVDVEFVLPRRSGAPKTFTPAHTRKPDVDKLLRCVGDALSKLVWSDDSRVIDWHGTKREAQPGERPGARIRARILPDRGAR